MSSPARQLDPATLSDNRRGDKMNAMFFSEADNFGGPPLPDADEHDVGDSREAARQQLEQPEKFSPIFTMVHNDASGERWHPHIHYIFADGSDEMLTNAVLHTLEGQPDVTAGEATKLNDATVAQSSTILKERYIILDLDATGQQVTSVQSLSPDWQVSETILTTAPSFSNTSSATNDAGMMLQIRGARSSPAETVGAENSAAMLEKAKVHSKHDIHDAMLSLAEKFQQDLDAVQALVRQWEHS